jgi:hypothetical protein
LRCLFERERGGRGIVCESRGGEKSVAKEEERKREERTHPASFKSGQRQSSCVLQVERESEGGSEEGRRERRKVDPSTVFSGVDREKKRRKSLLRPFRGEKQQREARNVRRHRRRRTTRYVTLRQIDRRERGENLPRQQIVPTIPLLRSSFIRFSRSAVLTSFVGPRSGIDVESCGRAG